MDDFLSLSHIEKTALLTNPFLCGKSGFIKNAQFDQYMKNLQPLGKTDVEIGCSHDLTTANLAVLGFEHIYCNTRQGEQVQAQLWFHPKIGLLQLSFEDQELSQLLLFTNVRPKAKYPANMEDGINYFRQSVCLHPYGDGTSWASSNLKLHGLLQAINELHLGYNFLTPLRSMDIHVTEFSALLSEEMKDRIRLLTYHQKDLTHEQAIREVLFSEIQGQERLKSLVQTTHRRQAWCCQKLDDFNEVIKVNKEILKNANKKQMSKNDRNFYLMLADLIVQEEKDASDFLNAYAHHTTILGHNYLHAFSFMPEQIRQQFLEDLTKKDFAAQSAMVLQEDLAGYTPSLSMVMYRGTDLEENKQVFAQLSTLASFEQSLATNHRCFANTFFESHVVFDVANELDSYLNTMINQGIMPPMSYHVKKTPDAAWNRSTVAIETIKDFSVLQDKLCRGELGSLSLTHSTHPDSKYQRFFSFIKKYSNACLYAQMNESLQQGSARSKGRMKL